MAGKRKNGTTVAGKLKARQKVFDDERAAPFYVTASALADSTLQTQGRRFETLHMQIHGPGFSLEVEGRRFDDVRRFGADLVAEIDRAIAEANDHDARKQAEIAAATTGNGSP